MSFQRVRLNGTEYVLAEAFDALLEAVKSAESDVRDIYQNIDNHRVAKGMKRTGQLHRNLRAAIAAAEGGREEEEPEAQPDYSKGVPRSVVLKRLLGPHYKVICSLCDNRAGSAGIGKECGDCGCHGMFVPILDDESPNQPDTEAGSALED
jgi:hypothetical protein